MLFEGKLNCTIEEIAPGRPNCTLKEEDHSGPWRKIILDPEEDHPGPWRKKTIDLGGRLKIMLTIT